MTVYPCSTCSHAVKEVELGKVRHLYILDCDLETRYLLTIKCNVRGCKCENPVFEEVLKNES